MTQHAANLLVISDLHLGEDLRGHERSADLDELEVELARFLDHYAQESRGGLPWRLVVNGDMVDFLAVCVTPEEAGVVTGWTPDDHFYGLGSCANSAFHKMRAVIARHGVFFRALARFVAAGHDVVIVMGNHDREFHWPGVQEAFRGGLATQWPDAVERRPLDEVVTFHDWFYFEPDLVWVEHGNQYDAYCSYDTILDPVDPTTEEFEENLSIVSMRYLGNLMKNPTESNDLSFADYIQMTFSNGTGYAMLMLTGYAVMIERMVRQYARRLWNPTPFEARYKRHRARVTRLAERTGLPVETLNDLMALRRPPMFIELMQVLRGLMLGRLIVTLGSIALVPVFLLSLPWAAGFTLVGVLVGITIAAHVVLAFQRDNVDPTEEMFQAARRIRRTVRAPFVVFGHSHNAIARATGPDGWYFNTGTWVGDAEKHVKVFTHLMIERSPRGVKAALCRWRDGQSRELRAERARS